MEQNHGLLKKTKICINKRFDYIIILDKSYDKYVKYASKPLTYLWVISLNVAQTNCYYIYTIELRFCN